MKEHKGTGSGLKGLTTYSFEDVDLKAKLDSIRAEKDMYREKYGSDWRQKYDMDKGHHIDYDLELRILNEGIYCGSQPMISGTSHLAACIHILYDERAHAVYGDAYDELRSHDRGDERAVKLLIEDAVRTGKWKELPEILHARYKSYVERGCVW